MINDHKVSVSLLVDSDNPLRHLNVHDGTLTIKGNDGTVFSYHKGCKPEPLASNEQQCCNCLTVTRGAEASTELPESSLFLSLDFENHYLEANFILDPVQALTLVDVVSPNISVDIL